MFTVCRSHTCDGSLVINMFPSEKQTTHKHYDAR